MCPRTIILNAFGPGECVTNEQLCHRTGRTLKNVSAWVAYLRHRGELKRCTPERVVPVAHMKADQTIMTSEVIVAVAIERVPCSVWALAKG